MLQPSINALLFLLPFLCVEAVLRFLPVADPPYILPVSAQAPVARLQPNVEYIYSRDWNFSVRIPKRTNNFGYVHRAHYSPAAATPLMAVIGDSFVEAHGIEPGGNLAELLHSTLAGSGRVYSIGLSGAPLSQYLVFAEFARVSLRPDAMAFVIINNDFDESLLKYKSDPRFHYFTDDGTLARIDYELSSTKRLLRESALARYVVHHLEPARSWARLRGSTRGAEPALEHERTADSRKAIDFFLEQLASKSGLAADSIVFVLDAVRPAIYSAQALEQAEEGYHACMRRYFAEQAAARGYHVLDMQPVFIARHRQDGSRFELAPTDSHWNALAHRLAAAEIQSSVPFQRVFRTELRESYVRDRWLLRSQR